MKKTIITAFLLAIMLCLYACGDYNEKQTNYPPNSSHSSQQSPSYSSQQTPSQNVTISLDFQEYRDNTSGKIGYAVAGPGRNTDKSLTIPNSYNGMAIIAVASKAFYGCEYLESIVFPSSLCTIGPDAFACCKNLKNVNLSNGITVIREYAFNKCTGLNSISIPVSVDRICVGAFQNCNSLTTITYAGTMAQWQKIKLESKWNYNVPASTVNCSDGVVPI